jgi:phospholipid N-methyltransferase
LARTIVEAADVRHASVVVEFGPGTGVFTAEILRQLPPDCWFFAMELVEEFAKATRQRCPQAEVVEASAAEVGQHLAARDCDVADAIISGLPWASFPEVLQDEILGAAAEALAPGGRFCTFAYVQGVWLPAGRRFKKKLDERFDQVEQTAVVWGNLPPAFVYRATKGKG